MTSKQLACFKAYDIRGRVPDELNPDLAQKIACGFSQVIKPKRVVVGHDIRLSGPAITDAVIAGFRQSGVDVTTIGQCGTEEIYFATAHLDMDGGIMVTASHNPQDYNGMKLVRDQAKPISGDTGLKEIEAATLAGNFVEANRPGGLVSNNVRDAYIARLLSSVDVRCLKPLKIVVNGGNGSAGPIVDAIEAHLPFELVKVHHQPDGSFPNGVPNPLLLKNRAATADVVKAEGADLGVAWDGDFDRCFFFDADGSFIEGYYVVGLLAERLLLRQPNAKIIHDPRLTWNTIELVRNNGGTPILSKTGHAFIKERMRAEDAVYGGEMSAHHYFKEFFYADSGMLPWLLVAEAVSTKGPLAQLVAERQQQYPISGEINRRLTDPAAAIAAIRKQYASGAQINEIDGLSFEYPNWRFNVRMSNTEPLLRLNVEARRDEALLRQKTEEILDLLAQLGAKA